jgi:oligopeptide/dipeptide ABC transporter ATP-binding protein
MAIVTDRKAVSAPSRIDDPSARPLLEIEDLRAYIETPQGTLRAVDGVSFHVDAGERLAIVGESGSGKTFTAMSITRLIPPNASIVSGSVTFAGRDLSELSNRDMVKYRGAEIATIFQDPMSSLNPLRTIGKQVAESLVVHRRATRREAKAIVPDLIAEVGLRNPRAVMKRYPFELSGGMLQRAAIAVALACKPKLLIADEPTTALDPTLQVQVLDLLTRLCVERNMAVILITHDMGVVRRFAQRVVVVYAGRMVEEGPIDKILQHPEHPYTRGLLAAIPGAAPRQALPTIPGSLPSLVDETPGCLFEPRCSVGHGDALCRSTAPARVTLGPSHRVACHYVGAMPPGESRPVSTHEAEL